MCHDKIYFLPSLAVAGLSIFIVVRVKLSMKKAIF